MRVISRIIFSLFGVIAGLAALELSVRVALPPPQIVTVMDNSEYLKKAEREQAEHLEATYQEGAIYTFENPFYLNTPTGRRLRKNSRVVVENDQVCQCRTEIRTNSLGLRGPEIGEKKPGVTRVLFIGDSVTLAHYVPEERSWVRQIQSISQSSRHPLETINGAVAATGLADELALLLEVGLTTDPDVVVLSYYLNDVQTSPGIRVRPLPGLIAWSELAQQLVRSIGVLNRRFGDVDYGSIDQPRMEQWGRETKAAFPAPASNPKGLDQEWGWKIQTFFADWGSAWSDSAWEYQLPLFRELKRQSEIHDFRLMIVMHPVADQVYAEKLFDYPQSKMKSIAADLNVPFLDLLPLLHTANRAGGGPLFYDWCHHTPAGNDLVAKWVAEFIDKQL